MRLDDAVGVKGTFELNLWTPEGALKEHRYQDNLIVTVGKNGICDQMVAAPVIAKPIQCAVGTGGGGPALGDTALTTELVRVAHTSKTRATNVLTMTSDFPAGTGTGALTEAGEFDNAAAGNLYARVVYSVVNKLAADVMQIVWTFTVA